MIEDIHINDYNSLVQEGSSIIYVMEEKNIIALIGVKDTLSHNAIDIIK